MIRQKNGRSGMAYWNLYKLVVHQNLGNAETYADCIKLLYEFDYINEELKINLIGMIGLRNILVHEYVAIDSDRLYELLNRLDGFSTFASAVKVYVS